MTDKEQGLRSATMRAIRDFERANDLPAAELVETDEGDKIQFLGAAPDGRQYGMAYLKRREVA